jgi:hypothetical protein
MLTNILHGHTKTILPESQKGVVVFILTTIKKLYQHKIISKNLCYKLGPTFPYAAKKFLLKISSLADNFFFCFAFHQGAFRTIENTRPWICFPNSHRVAQGMSPLLTAKAVASIVVLW